MTPEQFKAWRAHMGFSQTTAAKALGLSPDTVGNYDLGRRREGGEVTIPKPVELACAALALGITEYTGPTIKKPDRKIPSPTEDVENFRNILGFTQSRAKGE